MHRCSQQRGYPGIPFLEYTQEHLDAEFNAEKGCAPYCTVSCVHAVAVFDNWRRPQGPDGRSVVPEKRKLPVVS